MQETKKKLIAAAAMTLLIAAAAVINYRLTRVEPMAASAQAAVTPSPKAVQEGRDLFETYRQQRQDSLTQESEQLEMILNDAATDEETRRAAQEQLMALVASREAEQAIEALLKAKGFSQVAVVVHGENVSVIVGEESLSDTQSAQILEICLREATVQAKDVKIIPVIVTN